MEYISSNSIRMFPSANRNPTNDPASRLTTEYNIVNLVNRLINVNQSNGGSFVITQDNVLQQDAPFEFSLAGYYFRVEGYETIVGLFSSTPTDIYARFKITPPDAGGYFNELTALANGGEFALDTDGSGAQFVGVGFSSDTSGDEKYLWILHKNGSTWEIPESSKAKFSLKSPMGSTVTLRIDDGELETTPL